MKIIDVSFAAGSLIHFAHGFTVPISFRQMSRFGKISYLTAHNSPNENRNLNLFQKDAASATLAALVMLSTMFNNPTISQASYESYPDESTDTIKSVLQQLKDSTGDVAASFKAFENINDIITEGKGVGGSLSYKGVQLERGYVSDEDTTIYNPGLSLLTESEKNQIINAVINNRKENLSQNTWNEGNELAYENLKMRLDPLHMVELSGYLGIVPVYGAAVYLAVLAVQQNKREWFSTAYIIGAVAVFAPAIALILAGP